MSGDTQDVHSPGLVLHHEQDRHAPQQDGTGMQEITRQNARRLDGQELTPGRRRPARGLETCGGQDPTDRPLAGR